MQASTYYACDRHVSKLNNPTYDVGAYRTSKKTDLKLNYKHLTIKLRQSTLTTENALKTFFNRTHTSV